MIFFSSSDVTNVFKSEMKVIKWEILQAKQKNASDIKKKGGK